MSVVTWGISYTFYSSFVSMPICTFYTSVQCQGVSRVLDIETDMWIQALYFMCTVNTMDLVSVVPKGLEISFTYHFFLHRSHGNYSTHSITCLNMHPLISYSFISKLFPLHMQLTFDRPRAEYLSCTTNAMTIENIQLTHYVCMFRVRR